MFNHIHTISPFPLKLMCPATYLALRFSIVTYGNSLCKNYVWLSWNTAGKTTGFSRYQKRAEASGSTEMVVLALTWELIWEVQMAGAACCMSYQPHLSEMSAHPTPQNQVERINPGKIENKFRLYYTNTRITFIQDVPGRMDKTSGECSLCWTILI